MFHLKKYKSFPVAVLLIFVTSALIAQTSLSSGIATTPSGTNLVLRTNSSTTARLTILNASGTTQGYIGIGNSAPVDRLHVTGNVRANEFIPVTGIFNVPSASYDMEFRTNGVTRFFIDKSNGFVRIGSTTAPAHRLDVSGTVNATELRINNSVVTSSQWTSSSSNINYTTGMVSIGTTTAPVGYKLAVAGKTVTEEVVVKLQGNWPDYVFADSYELMPLAELERYINQNRHLPEVPSAKEVSDNGVALGEMNATLLKKIEELTLYMIELKKENEAQQKQIEALMKKH